MFNSGSLKVWLDSRAQHCREAREHQAQAKKLKAEGLTLTPEYHVWVMMQCVRGVKRDNAHMRQLMAQGMM